jgi:DNA-binding winged helix-turn-helix (wHTH) protein/lipoprotein NlpI
MQFDGWTVDRVSGDLSRDGRASRLPQQPLRILIELYDHAGTVVTREQLVRVLWPAGVVDFDNGLNVAMRKLRVALDDVGEMPRYIETIPRRGYRFIGKRHDDAVAVAAAPGPAISERPTPRTRLALALTLLALASVLALSWWQWRRAPARHLPTERAQELYLEGMQQRNLTHNDAARVKLEEALREDPNYPEAWVMYGELLSNAVVRQMLPPAEGLPKARAAAERAVALDPSMAENHILLGQIHLDHDKEFAAAKREFDIALKLNAHSARAWHYMAMWHGQLGHIDEALLAIRRAREIEPARPLFEGNYALLLYEARRYEEVIAFLKPAIVAMTNFDHGRSVMARALISTGDFPGAAAELDARGSTGVFQAERGVLFAKQGRREDAMREMEAFEALKKRGFAVAYQEALIYATLGELDRGCEALARAVTDGSPLVNWMRLEPWLDPLRGRQCYADAERALYRD